MCLYFVYFLDCPTLHHRNIQHSFLHSPAEILVKVLSNLRLSRIMLLFYTFLGAHVYVFLLDIYLGVVLLDHNVCMFSILVDNI